MTSELENYSKAELKQFKNVRIIKYPEGFPIRYHVTELRDDDFDKENNLNIIVHNSGDVNLKIIAPDAEEIDVKFSHDGKVPSVAQIISGMVESLADHNGDVPQAYYELGEGQAEIGERKIGETYIMVDRYGTRIKRIEGDNPSGSFLNITITDAGDAGLYFFTNRKGESIHTRAGLGMSFVGGPNAGGQASIIARGFMLVARELAKLPQK